MNIFCSPSKRNALVLFKLARQNLQPNFDSDGQRRPVGFRIAADNLRRAKCHEKMSALLDQAVRGPCEAHGYTLSIISNRSTGGGRALSYPASGNPRGRGLKPFHFDICAILADPFGGDCPARLAMFVASTETATHVLYLSGGTPALCAVSANGSLPLCLERKGFCDRVMSVAREAVCQSLEARTPQIPPDRAEEIWKRIEDSAFSAGPAG